MAELARELDEKAWCNGEAYSLADIATGCALGYLDLRHPHLQWRNAYPYRASLAKLRASTLSPARSAHPTKGPLARAFVRFDVGVDQVPSVSIVSPARFG